MENQKLFGRFLRECRVRKNTSVRKMAQHLGISPVYLSDIENGKTAAPSIDVILRMIDFLELSRKEIYTFYDYSAFSKKAPAASPDLSHYIMERSFVRDALRTAMEMNITEEDWNKFTASVKNQSQK